MATKRSRAIAQFVNAAVFDAWRWLTRALPPPVVAALCGGIASVLTVAARKPWNAAVERVRTAYPDLGDAECRAIVRRSFGHWGRVLAELMTGRAPCRELIGRSVHWTQGVETLDAAAAAGRGAVLAMPHQGNFFYAISWLAARYGAASIAKRVHYAPLQASVDRMYADLGVRIYYHNGPSTQAVNHLRRGGFLVVLPDLEYPRMRGADVRFLGSKTRVQSGPAALAMLSGAALIPVCVRWDGKRYEGTAANAIDLPAYGRGVSRADFEHAVAAATSVMAERFNEWILADPAQWAWMQAVRRHSHTESRGAAVAADGRCAVDLPAGIRAATA